MKYLKTITILLAIFVIVSTFLVPVDSSNPPPEPDDAHVDSFEEWMKQWEKDNMDPAAKDVNDAYDRFSGLVGDYRDAINSVGGVAFSGVSNSVQTSWVAMVMSLYNTSKEGAKAIAETQTLQSAVELAASHHSTYLYNYNELYDRHGTIDAGTVATQVQQEIAQHGGISVSASTMMEAYWKYYYIAEDYNAKVDVWNAYAPSQAKDKVFTTVPSKAEFDKFRCFGGCNYEHDTLDYARDTHQEDCGTAENIDEVLQRAPIYVPLATSYEFRSRTVGDGCGRPYYACNLDDREAHLEQTCSTSGCSVQYRNCLPHTKDHNNHVSSSDEQAQNTQTPVDNSLNCEYCTGSCSACYQLSYHPCGFHETSVSGDHSLQASCPETNESGYSCTVTGFYACQTHTHQYPTLVRCGRKVNGYRVCDESVLSEQQHYVTCPNGHSHWSCKSEDYNHHRLRTCGNLYRSGVRCNKTWRRCRFYAEPISGTAYVSASPRCPTDPNGNRYCAE